ncbi:probable G-protein coupled receptor Mth-like 10 [Musca autumnalis]|uniref:probable G-protein coupled receptor Mth-like 10 n=1 Tax=Musca autumnalis TaxID=221902 RepID=UPI003CF74971
MLNRSIRRKNISMTFLHLFGVIFVITAVAAVGKFKCQDRYKLCMKLCCDKNQFYNFNKNQCQMLSEDADVSWNKELILGPNFFRPVDLLKEFDFEEQTPCKSSRNFTNFDYERLNTNYVFGNYCFTPYFASEQKQYVLLPIDLNCNETVEVENAQEISVAATKNMHIAIFFTIMIITIVLAVLTMFIYGSIKELRQNMQTKLFVSYGISLILPLIEMMVVFYDIFYPFIKNIDYMVVIDRISMYLGIASLLWSNVICYEMRRNMKKMNHRHDLREIWIRFLWYSLFVWGLSLALLAINSYTVGRYSIYADVFTIIFLALNFLIFCLLTFEILRSSFQVAKLEYGSYKIMKNFRMLIRLAIMMGLSQITYYLTTIVSEKTTTTLRTTFYIMGSVYMVDAILIFLLFVFKRNVLDILKSKFGCSCCSKQIDVNDVWANIPGSATTPV